MARNIEDVNIIFEKDEDGLIVASVPNIPGFFSQGENFEEARHNLRDAIEGNLVVALQLGFAIPAIEGVEIREADYAEVDAAQTQRGRTATLQAQPNRFKNNCPNG